MSFITILETILIGPLKLLFEVIFSIANRLLKNPGLAIIMLSLTMNILVLPLYRRADAMQEEARDIDAKLRDGVAHIKKTFSGDERMMILQTYYRQNHYKPTDALNGSVSLLLEIPFFMAAYQYLSHLDILNGVSLGPINDLGAPDGLLVIGGIAINVLPILMTLINIISSTLYAKGFPLKTKIQLYVMALFFLIFLYQSPACLVFYWTLNNVFSLVKTIFYKLKNPRKVIDFLTSAAGILLLCVPFIYDLDSLKKKLFVLLLGGLLQLPLLASLVMTKGFFRIKDSQPQPNQRVFVLGSVFLTLLVGLLIPSALIADSPQEFVVINIPNVPFWYIVSCLCLAAGTFLVWLRVFYWLANPVGKAVFDKLVWILCGVMLVNYMFFGTNLGTISTDLKYEGGLIFSRKEKIINLLVLILLALLLYVCITKWKRSVAFVLFAVIVAVSGMSVLNLASIRTSLAKVNPQDMATSGTVPKFQLSTTGKNVVVLMLDRAMGEYIPYIFEEKPELKEQFSGFTYYSNTISYGGFTNFAAPALFGGYEYTPVEMNKRSSETLVSKQNEALKVMPVIFAENGYDVTVCDPVYANYQWTPDLSIYNEYPTIQAYNTEGKFNSENWAEQAVQNNYRNFFCFSLMKSFPLCMQSIIYDKGRYYQMVDNYSSQTQESLSEAKGIESNFLHTYYVLTNLPTMMTVTSEETNTYLSIVNNITHQPTLLQAPDYTPAETVNNKEYDAAHIDRFTVDGRTLIVKNTDQMAHYHANMASMIQLGQWFDYLRENNVYDNTRIILVSDHGRALFQHDELILGEGDGLKDVEYYYPLLMVKDFGQKGFTTSHEFMTNADVPTLAMENIIQNPINPFTGNAISSDEKNAHEQYIIRSTDWHTTDNGECTFVPAKWASVKDDLWDKNNWVFYDDEIVLAEHAAP